MEQDRTALQGKLADDVKKATDERARLDAERLRLVNTVEGLRTDHASWAADCARIQGQRQGELDLLNRERDAAHREEESRRTKLRDLQIEMDAAADQLHQFREELADIAEVDENDDTGEPDGTVEPSAASGSGGWADVADPAPPASTGVLPSASDGPSRAPPAAGDRSARSPLPTSAAVPAGGPRVAVSLRRRIRHLERIRFLRLRAVRHPRMMMRGTKMASGRTLSRNVGPPRIWGSERIRGSERWSEGLEFRETPGFRESLSRASLCRVEAQRNRHETEISLPLWIGRLLCERIRGRHRFRRNGRRQLAKAQEVCWRRGGGSDDDRKKKHHKHTRRSSRDVKPRRKKMLLPQHRVPRAPGAPDGDPGLPGDIEHRSSSSEEL